MIRIAHLSDLHFGRLAYPEIVEVLVEEVNAQGVALVVVSGDLTQRARRRQFEAAVAMFDAFAAPTLVVPGNHDVYTWWHRPLARLVRPLHRYRRYVTDDLTPSFEQPGLAVLGVNSAHGWAITGGWVGAVARARIAAFFAGRGREVFKILVVHHPLTRLSGKGRHDVARRGRQALEAAAQAGVELVLGGHLHVPRVEAVTVGPARRRLVVAHAGTAASDRWRAPHVGANFYNLIEIDPARFTIEARRYDPAAGRFEPAGRTAFDRIPPE